MIEYYFLNDGEMRFKIDDPDMVDPKKLLRLLSCPDAELPERIRINPDRQKLVAALLFGFVLPNVMPPPNFEEGDGKPNKKQRKGNEHRDRFNAIEFVRSWDDEMFYRQFRLCRLDFYFVLQLISPRLDRNAEMARRSSGSTICTELRLCITMRTLAGAEYLDMIHFRVDVDHVSDIVWEVVSEINVTLLNINMPTTVAEWTRLAEGYASVQKKRWGSVLTPGIALSGDGVVFKKTQPTLEELAGRPVSTFMNRGGYWALVCQAFCDSYTRFCVFEVGWPGSTSDITAYQQTALYVETLKEGAGAIPAWVHFALDEIYGCFGGMHLTPYSKALLRKARNRSMEEYFKMRGFNHILSSQRITIERAFGIFMRTLGFCWKPIEYSLERAATILRVCAKLHNLRVDRWIKNGGARSRGQYYAPAHGGLEPPAHEGIPSSLSPCDREVMEELRNKYITIAGPEFGRKSQVMRDAVAEFIWNSGIRFTSDDDFLVL
jgi:DDE superfamily endonuclease